jgi:hypothetical protein
VPRYYYFTTEAEWRQIEAQGFIPTQPHGLGIDPPEIVWLTDEPDYRPHPAWPTPESRIRFEIEFADQKPFIGSNLRKWTDWKRSHAIEPRLIHKVEIGGGVPDHWFLIADPIGRAHWVDSLDVTTGKAPGEQVEADADDS